MNLSIIASPIYEQNPWLDLVKYHFKITARSDLESKEFFDLISANKEVFLRSFEPRLRDLKKDKKIVAINLVCQLFTYDTLQTIDRKTVMIWMNQFEEFWDKLNPESLGNAVLEGHNRHYFKEEEIKRKIEVVCEDNQKESLPLLLLLRDKVFQEKLHSDPKPWKLKKTANTVVAAFRHYLYHNTLPKYALEMASDTFVQLFDLSRSINDDYLTSLCLDKLNGVDEEEYLQHASHLAHKGKEAFDNNEIETAIQYLEESIRVRPTDLVSTGILGKIYLNKKEYLKAMACFENVLHGAHFEEDYYLYQVQAILEYVKGFKKSIKNHIDDFYRLAKMSQNFKEDIESPLSESKDSLHEYLTQNEQLDSKFGFLKEITGIFNDESSPLEEQIEKAREYLDEMIEDVTEKLLSEAKKILEKMPTVEIDSLLLKIEILLEKEEYEDAENVFVEIEERTKDVKLSNDQKIRCHQNLAKLYLFSNQCQLAKEEYIKAFALDKENEETRLGLLPLGFKRPDYTIKDLVLKYEEDFNIQLDYGMYLLSNNEPEKALTHLLKADKYNAKVNYCLGKTDYKKNYYFNRALKTADIDGLEAEFCIEIINYFLNSTEETEWDQVIDLTLQIATFDPKLVDGDLLNALSPHVEKAEHRNRIEEIMKSLVAVPV